MMWLIVWMFAHVGLAALAALAAVEGQYVAAAVFGAWSVLSLVNYILEVTDL